jgi:hypothetical protein
MEEELQIAPFRATTAGFDKRSHRPHTVDLEGFVLIWMRATSAQEVCDAPAIGSRNAIDRRVRRLPC